MIPTSIDGTDITGATIDGTDVQEITLDGDTVFTAGPPILHDFESNSLNISDPNWGSFTGGISVISSSQINGSFVGQIATSGDTEASVGRNSGNQPTEVSLLTKITQRNGSFSDRLFYILGDFDKGERLAFYNFRQDGSLAFNGSVLASWSTNETYKIRFHNIDFTAETLDTEVVEIDSGSSIFTNTSVAFAQSTSQCSDFIFGTDTDSGSSTQLLDDFIWNPI